MLDLLDDDLGWVVLEHLALRFHRFGESGIRDVPVRERSPPSPIQDLGQALDVLGELPGEPRLPDAGGAEDRNERRSPLRLDALQRLLQHGELLVPANQSRLEAEGRALASPPCLHAEG